ncbi:MAG: OmpA family protein, partial [Cyclonatronaceae bacterium]
MNQLSSTFSVSACLLAGALFLSACGSSQETVDETPDVITMEYLESLEDEELQQMDSDGDGVSDYDEMFVHDTDPLGSDSDDDGLSDGDEVDVYGTDPLNPDTDEDGLNDYDEVMVHNTDPLVADTDGDGLSDFDEIDTYNTDPLSTDTDGDGLSDYDELMAHESNPLNPDTDGDGFTDGQELEMGTDMLDADDPVVVRELEEVNFDFDRSNLDSQARELLSENVERLETNPNYEVRVEAFT